jgi:uncharacterized protein YeaO (DUF488 family)
MPPEHDIAALIESARTADAAVLHERCWPRGGDRTDAVAREWVRLWGPQRAFPLEWDAPAN